MLQKYSKTIDEKWQKIWAESKLYRFDRESTKKKLYLLEMFSYPSGSKLHLGHWWNYSLPDSWGRMKRMQGYNVFHPMGFDAFGLPAENYAIKTGIHPKDSTERNIATMEEQLRALGATFDWDYEIKTCDPDYYKWTQWLFIQLYKKGLAYRKNAPVNWCPGCQTVLANEQAAGGVCERCHSVVEHKNLTQWFLKITDYADELLAGLKTIDWPDKTKKIQENWIGRSVGAEVVFAVEGSEQKIPVFTTRADTLLGVTYVVVAPESDLLPPLIKESERDSVTKYCAEALKQDEIARLSTVKEKTGVFTGSYAIHPLTGEKVPVWVSDYVIASYGTGAVMAVPAHDERDYAFSTKFGLPIKEVVTDKAHQSKLPYTEHGYLVNSGKYNGLFFDKAVEAIVADLEKSGKGKATINYRLRDWSVSRQRYWGAPIPMIYCEHCGAVPVPEKDLPVELPYNVEFKPNGSSPLASCEEFVHTVCPTCGKPALRETDTLDTFVCSSWYYLRYPYAQMKNAPWDKDEIDKFMPVDTYVGGVEHAAMHLLYARFVYKALRDMGYVQGDEPFQKLVHQGIILGADGAKMSKSAGNTVSADEYVDKFGSDVFRTYLAFGFSYIEGGPWSDEGVKAIDRFFGRIAEVVNRFTDAADNTVKGSDEELDFVRHRTIRAVTQDMDRFQFNTAVARLMEFVTAIGVYQKGGRCRDFEKAVIVDLILLLCPLAPHFGEELWSAIGGEGSVFNQNWPTFDESKLNRSTAEVAVQINSKIVSRISIPADADEATAFEAAMAEEKVATLLRSRTVVKKVYIKGRLLNLIVK